MVSNALKNHLQKRHPFNKNFSLLIKRLTLPACRAQTRLSIIEVTVPSLRCPTIVCAVGNITGFSLPVLGTFTFKSVAAVIQLALSSAGAIIGTHIETANIRERRFVSNETGS